MHRNEALLVEYRLNGATSQNLNEAEVQALRYQGYNSWDEYLTDLGFVGTQQEKLYQYLVQVLVASGDIVLPTPDPEPTPPAVVFDCTEAEAISSGADGTFTFTNSGLTAARELGIGASSATYLAFPTGILSMSSETFTVAGIMGIRYNLDSLPVHAAGTGWPYLVRLGSYDDSLSDLHQVDVRALDDGTAQVEVDTLPNDTIVEGDWVGLYWNAGTGQMGVVVSGVDQGYIGSYTGNTRVPILTLVEAGGIDAAWTGESVQVSLVLDAASMGTGWPVGCTDIQGDTI